MEPDKPTSSSTETVKYVNTKKTVEHLAHDYYLMTHDFFRFPPCLFLWGLINFMEGQCLGTVDGTRLDHGLDQGT